jgi:hypothetical protein
MHNAVETMDDSRYAWRLEGDADFTIGAHLVTARCGYTHHGIYAGDGKVVHYAGLSRLLHRGPVQEVSFSEFSGGRPVWIKHDPDSKYSGKDAVRRAYFRIGENRYRLITNNCEHFCSWCVYGESRSDQVDAWMNWSRTALHAVTKAIRKFGHGKENSFSHGWLAAG